MEYVEYKPEHYEQVLEFFRQVTVELGWDEDARLSDEIRRIPETYVMFIVALQNGEVVGTGGLKESDQAWACKLKRDRVRADYRGQGVGRTLVNMRLQKAAELGYRVAVLDTNPAAMGFYQSVGFRVTATGPSRHGRPKIWMAKDL